MWDAYVAHGLEISEQLPAWKPRKRLSKVSLMVRPVLARVQVLIISKDQAGWCGGADGDR